jgi:hypothetical protein
MNDAIKIISIVVLIIAILIFGPLVTIWALNTLFPVLAIEYNLATWFAAFWLFAFVAYKGQK